MRTRRPWHAALAAWLLAASTFALAEPVSVASLQRLLKDTPRHELRFQETRDSPWLAASIESTGTLSVTPAMLEKRVQTPRRETWRILDDRMQWVAPAGGAGKDILFSQAPAVAALARALRNAVAGDLQALDKDFRLVPGGDERLWTLQLTPRSNDISRHLKQLELQGTGKLLQVIVIVEAKGDRTTTRLLHDNNQGPPCSTRIH